MECSKGFERRLGFIEPTFVEIRLYPPYTLISQFPISKLVSQLNKNVFVQFETVQLIDGMSFDPMHFSARDHFSTNVVQCNGEAPLHKHSKPGPNISYLLQKPGKARKLVYLSELSEASCHRRNNHDLLMKHLFLRSINWDLDSRGIIFGRHHTRRFSHPSTQKLIKIRFISHQ